METSLGWKYKGRLSMLWLLNSFIIFIFIFI